MNNTDQLSASLQQLGKAADNTASKMRGVTASAARFNAVTSPKKGEMFKLVWACKPRVSVLETCKALGLPYPPILLTYVGSTSKAEVTSLFRL